MAFETQAQKFFSLVERLAGDSPANEGIGSVIGIEALLLSVKRRGLSESLGVVEPLIQEMDLELDPRSILGQLGVATMGVTCDPEMSAFVFPDGSAVAVGYEGTDQEPSPLFCGDSRETAEALREESVS